MKDLKKQTVLVTRIIPEDKLVTLNSLFNLITNNKTTTMSRKELKEKVKNVDAILCFLNDKIDKEIMTIAGPSLKVISTYSTGYEHIDIDEARRRNIKIGYTGEILTETTADLAFGLMLSLGRRILEADKFTRDLKWKFGWSPDLMIGTDIHHKTIGIIGMGKIGFAVAKRAAGFNMKILFTKRKFHQINNEYSNTIKMEHCKLEKLLSESDYVIVCCSLNKDSYHLINYEKLSLMKRSSFIINIARGKIINEKDLILSLQNNLISGAGLDVFEEEPIKSDNPLLKMKNVILLPHIGSATITTRNQMAEIAISNIIKVLNDDDDNNKEGTFLI